MKYLITGVAGLLGSRLADWIIENTDNEVIGVDDLSGGYIENVNSKVKFYKFDLVDLDKVDEVMVISTEEAKERSRRLCKEMGLLVGISAGANVLAAERWIEENNPGGIVFTSLCDRGERYCSCI